MRGRPLGHGGGPPAADCSGHVRTWRRRFLGKGLDGLWDESRPGVPRKITDADVERVIIRTLGETRRHRRTQHTGRRGRWGRRRACRSRPSQGLGGVRAGTSPFAELRLSTDPFFIDKVRDVVVTGSGGVLRGGRERLVHST
ncbi:helix-turn-helix domain-containing protein [Streptomyces sp. NPDC088707]|uniref:helix-turn-helix domain-containing protein n=1 Tax=Streptomyces sp. NPDC088707 TaxID=3365871 RepID=UPI00382E01ED